MEDLEMEPKRLEEIRGVLEDWFHRTIRLGGPTEALLNSAKDLFNEVEFLRYKETQWMGYIHPCEHEDAVGKMEYEIEKLKEENRSLRYLIAMNELCSSQDIFDRGYCPQCGGLGGHRPVEVDIEGNALPCRWGSIAEGYWNEVDSEEEWE